MATQVKRGPGRPSRKPEIPPVERRGVVYEAENEDNEMEWVYDSPPAFKALFTYLKSLKAKKILMAFNTDGVVIYAKDHSESSTTVVKIDGEKMNLYYCADVMYIEFSRDLVDKMFMNADKTFHKISITKSETDPDALSFVFEDMILDKESCYRIEVAVCDQIPEEFTMVEEITESPDHFPLEFTLTVKQFEKTITDTITQSPEIDIIKVDGDPLELYFSKAGVTYREVYKDNDKIELTCRLEPGYSFKSQIRLMNIKSLVGSMVTDKVRICCGDDGRLMFRLVIKEEAIIVNSLTESF